MATVRHRALTIAATLGLLVVVGCGSDDDEVTRAAVGAHGDPSTTSVSEPEPPSSSLALEAFVLNVAGAPAYSAADFSLPATPALMLEQSSGAMRGIVTSVVALDAESSVLTAPGEAGSTVSFPMRELGVSIEVQVGSVLGPVAGVEAGSIVVVNLPLYKGPPEFLENAIEEYVDPVVDSAPVGAEALFTVSTVSSDQGEAPVAELSGIGTFLLEGNEGISSAVVWTDGALWGAQTLDDVERLMLAG